jgi:hypothetical protein
MESSILLELTQLQAKSVLAAIESVILLKKSKAVIWKTGRITCAAIQAKQKILRQLERAKHYERTIDNNSQAVSGIAGNLER